MSKITINGITVDPVGQAPALAAANLQAPDASGSDYILVQTKEPLDKAKKAELANKGAVILEYVPDDTYLCQFKSTNLDDIRALPYVAWANVYMRGFKLAPALAGLPTEPHVHNLMEMTVQPDRTLSRTPKVVDVVFHEDVDPAQVRDKIAAAAGIDPADLQVSRHKVRLAVQQRNLPDLSAIDEVRHVEEVHPYKLNNDVARHVLNIDTPDPAMHVTFEGDGQFVAVADTGFDMGSITDVHPAFTGRVAKLYPMGRPTKTNDPDGHGTHVSGSILGDGHSDKLGIDVKGTAPKARLVLQSVLDSKNELGGLPVDLHDLFRIPYEDDQARIHSDSWGSTLGDGRYDSNAREVDDFVWTHRDMIVCFAAGNDGTDANGDGHIDAQSVSPPGTAKNCITVGATENNRPEKGLTYGQGWPRNFPSEPIASDRVANDPEGVVAFSSRGPTRDLRIKPDVVAPGTFILSARSRATRSSGWETSSDPLYMYEGGTSMATPLVAGCAALVREYLEKERSMPSPSAALVKAMLINGAHDVTGQFTPTEAGATPNYAEGFGRVDVSATVGPFADGIMLEIQDEGTELDTGDEERMTITIGENAPTLKATLVWTDYPGEGLQNDLDLIVKTTGGEERHGNMPASSMKFDRKNNVEQVVWRNMPAGDAEVIVRAHRAVRAAQSYALVVRVV